VNFDAIVVGTGGVGSSSMLHLARRGLSVLGLDRFPPGHDRGSSHGESRIIRRSYFEHPDYVPLLNRSYELWDELATLTDKPLLQRTGLLYVGRPNGDIIRGVRDSAQTHDLNIEELTTQDATDRFSVFSAPDESTAIFEADAGFLRVEDCVVAHIDQAMQLGAELRHGETVMNWTATEDRVCVETDAGHYEAARLIITAGAWASDVLATLNLPLRVVRKHMHWYRCDDERHQLSHGAPCFFFETLGGYFYGFPAMDDTGLKIAEHSSGMTIDDPLTASRTPDAKDTARVEQFLRQHIPGVSAERLRHAACLYTMTPDEHFVVDRHPEHGSVAFAAGLSGHGFKFTTALGEVLADLVLDERSSLDINFLSHERNR